MSVHFGNLNAFPEVESGTVLFIICTIYRNVDSNLTDSWGFGSLCTHERNKVIGSLSTDVFEQRTTTGSGLCAILGCDFEHIFQQLVSIGIKTLSSTNKVA